MCAIVHDFNYIYLSNGVCLTFTIKEGIFIAKEEACEEKVCRVKSLGYDAVSHISRRLLV